MFLKLRPKSDFTKNVLTLMAGTGIAQAIPVALSPILTRLYSPEDFGVFALYMAISSVIGVMATGRYELAIMLPRKESDAASLVMLSLGITVAVTTLTSILIFFFQDNIAALLDSQEITRWLYFIPFTVLMTGLYQSLNYWSNRKKEYRRLAFSRVIQSSVTITTQIGGGYGALGSAGLVSGTIAGQGVAALILGSLVWNEDKAIFRRSTAVKCLGLAKRYVDFAKFQIPGAAINAMAVQAPTFLLSMLFSVASTGLYELARRVIDGPTSILANSLADVFRQHAIEAFRSKDGAFPVLKKMSTKTLVCASIFALVVFPLLEPLTVVIFGSSWVEAAVVMKILLPMLVIRFSVMTYTSVCMQFLQRLDLDLIWQCIFLIISVLSFFVGKSFNSWTIGLIIYSISTSCMYIASWILVAVLLKRQAK